MYAVADACATIANTVAASWDAYAHRACAPDAVGATAKHSSGWKFDATGGTSALAELMSDGPGGYAASGKHGRGKP